MFGRGVLSKSLYFMNGFGKTMSVKNRNVILLLAMVSLILFLIPFMPVNSGSKPSNYSGDKFDKNIGKINTLEGIEELVPKYLKNTGNGNRDEAKALAEIVELHTLHGVSKQGWRENWIANLIDKLGIPYASFSGRMRPDDLIKDNIAFCSQASLILQELFRRKGITYATVRFNVGGNPPHSAVAAKPDGVWRYYDSSYEPNEQGVPFDTLVSSDQFLSLYGDKSWGGVRVGQEFNRLAKEGKVKIIAINGPPPRRGILFQYITETFSRYAWMMSMAALMVYYLVKSKK